MRPLVSKLVKPGGRLVGLVGGPCPTSSYFCDNLLLPDCRCGHSKLGVPTLGSQTTSFYLILVYGVVRCGLTWLLVRYRVHANIIVSCHLVSICTQ